MLLNIEDVYRRLVFLFLRAPRNSFLSESRASRMREHILKNFSPDPSKDPVTGVGLTRNERGDMEACILLREDIEDFSLVVQQEMQLGDFRITQLTTGEIRLNSRPAVGGDSLGEGVPGGQSGTLGCVVEDAANDLFILTCNHVLSNGGNSQRGTPVWQPSDRDGGSQADLIGTLYDFAPITFGGFTANYIDAALVQPTHNLDVRNGLKKLGPLNGTASSINHRTPVEKVGWKTKHTKGTYLYKTSFIQPYPGNQDALFEDQLGIVGVIGDFSRSGDSGSLVVNNQREAVGLVFAEASDINMTFANPIDKVFNYFGVNPA